MPKKITLSMSQLRVEKHEISATSLGLKSPFPPLKPLEQFTLRIDPNVPVEDREYINHGLDAGILPYRLQNGYDRNKKPGSFKVIVLENDILRAEFLPQLGGCLRSLFHKPANKELLYKNSVFQPDNLAIREAWFSGGIEWNVSVRGHTPFTCASLFAGQASLDDGT